MQNSIVELKNLPHTRLLDCSNLYWNKFIGNDAEQECLNAVVAIETELAPITLMQSLLQIEHQHHRQRRMDKTYCARTLDLDLLLYGNETINEPSLTIPHPRMTERAFVIHPLAEIAPQLVLPTGEGVTALCQRLVWDARIVALEPSC